MGLLNQGLNNLFIPSERPYITDSLTLTTTWTAGDVAERLELSGNIRSFSFRLTFTHVLNQDGIILESGAAGFGQVIFVLNNSIRWLGGVGNNANRILGGNYIALSSPISPGIHTVEISASNTEAAMWIDKVQVDIGTTSNPDQIWAGSNEGGYGRIIGGVADNPVPNDTIYPGLSGVALIYREQTVL